MFVFCFCLLCLLSLLAIADQYGWSMRIISRSQGAEDSLWGCTSSVKTIYRDAINFIKNPKGICSLLNQCQFVNNYLGSGKMQEQVLNYLQSCICALLLMRIVVFFSGKTCFIFTSVICELFFLILVGSSDQTWSLGQGHEDQNVGTHLPLLSSHQGKYHLFYLLGYNDPI